MKFKLVFLISLVLLFQVVSAQEKGVKNQSVDKLPSENKRWALIIGVDNYRDDISPLYGSVNDAKALKDVLVKNAGFPEKQVILMTTDSADVDLIPNRGNVLDQLDKLSRQIPEEGLLLFSFSGHGVSIGKDAFLIPSDGKIYENPELLRERSIDVLRIRKAIEATKATQVLMLLDACRNDPLKGKGDEPNRLTEAFNNGFSFDTKNKGIAAFATIYATSFGDRAFEFLDKQTQKHRGFFSYAIEEGLRGKAANQKGEITLGGLIDYIEKTVKDRVYVEKNQRQVPYPMTEGFNNSNLVLAIGGSNVKTPYEIAWEKYHKLYKALGKYDEIAPAIDGLAKVKKNGKYGFINMVGEEVIPVKYDALGLYEFVEVEDDDSGDSSMQELDSSKFSEGLVRAKLNGKWGFLDKTGKTTIPFIYEKADSFSEGLSPVKFNGKWGLIEKSGNTILPFKLKYDNIYAFANGYAQIEITCPEVTTGENGELLEGSAKNLEIIRMGKCGNGLIDKSGNVVLIPKYFQIQTTDKDNILALSNGKIYFFDKTGKQVLNYETPVENLSKVEFIAVFENGNKFYVDKTGKTFVSNEVLKKLEEKYSWSGNTHRKFEQGIASIDENLKVGFVDKGGKLLIEPKYDHVFVWNAFKVKGFIQVYMGRGTDEQGLVDKTGKEVIPPIYEFAEPMALNLFRVKLNSKWGMLDENRKVIIPIKYDKLWEFFVDGVYEIELNGKKGFVDLQGNEYFFDN